MKDLLAAVFAGIGYTDADHARAAERLMADLEKTRPRVHGEDRVEESPIMLSDISRLLPDLDT